jgi:hippurate hydrolase
VTGLFRELLGEENVKERPPIMGGEDFGRYGKDGTPICIYFLGTISQEKYDEGQKPGGPILPSLHANSFAPLPEPSIRTGVRTMTLAVMDLMPKK